MFKNLYTKKIEKLEKRVKEIERENGNVEKVCSERHYG